MLPSKPGGQKKSSLKQKTTCTFSLAFTHSVQSELRSRSSPGRPYRSDFCSLLAGFQAVGSEYKQRLIQKGRTHRLKTLCSTSTWNNQPRAAGSWWTSLKAQAHKNLHTCSLGDRWVYEALKFSVSWHERQLDKWFLHQDLWQVRLDRWSFNDTWTCGIAEKSLNSRKIVSVMQLCVISRSHDYVCDLSYARRMNYEWLEIDSYSKQVL